MLAADAVPSPLGAGGGAPNELKRPGEGPS